MSVRSYSAVLPTQAILSQVGEVRTLHSALQSFKAMRAAHHYFNFRIKEKVKVMT
jgi:hypothetical protein